jgi:hypothetical protein
VVNKTATAPFKLPAVEAVSAALQTARPSNPPNLLPPQHGTNAREQFSHAERLDDIIICAEFEADYPIDFLGTTACDDDDRDVGIRSNRAQDIEPIILAEVQIENDQAGMHAGEMLAQLPSVRDRTGENIMVGKMACHRLPYHWIVVNDQDAAYLAQISICAVRARSRDSRARRVPRPFCGLSVFLDHRSSGPNVVEPSLRRPQSRLTYLPVEASLQNHQTSPARGAGLASSNPPTVSTI